MLVSRLASTFLCATLLAFSLTSRICAQQSPPGIAARGVELYRQGNNKEAIKALRAVTKKHKDDTDAWHYLALAYGSAGKKKDSRKALARAIVLREELFWKEYKEWYKEDGSLSQAARDSRRARFVADAQAALESVESYLRPDTNDANLWREHLDALRFYVVTASEPKQTLFSAREVTKKAIITHKQEPSFTEKARESKVTGLVRLRLVLGFDGHVRRIFVVLGLPDGLTEEAVKAAERIKFIPAIKDGRPVSQFVTIEYNFNVY
jgi:TonB family protein